MKVRFRFLYLSLVLTYHRNIFNQVSHQISVQWNYSNGRRYILTPGKKSYPKLSK